MRKLSCGQSQAAFLMSTGRPSGMLEVAFTSAFVESPLWMQMFRSPGFCASIEAYLLEVITSNIGYARLPSSSRHWAISESGLLSSLALFDEVYPFHESGLRFSICQAW